MLGVTKPEALELFNFNNTPAQIRRMVTDLQSGIDIKASSHQANLRRLEVRWDV